MTSSTFQILQADPGSSARRGRLVTPHGVVETPVFMPVGTQATVKAMMPAVDGKGGGKPALARGGGARVDGIPDALEAAVVKLGELLGS